MRILRAPPIRFRRKVVQEMKEERYITFSITIEQIAKNLQKLKNDRMAQFGLRSVHATCLVRLGQSKNGLTGAELAESCEVDKSLISRVIGELEEKGYVFYEVCDKKYRRKIFLTDSGVRVLDEIRKILSDAVDAVRGNLSDAEVEIFYRVLNYFDGNICSLFGDGTSEN